MGAFYRPNLAACPPADNRFFIIPRIVFCEVIIAAVNNILIAYLGNYKIISVLNTLNTV